MIGERDWREAVEGGYGAWEGAQFGRFSVSERGSSFDLNMLLSSDECQIKLIYVSGRLHVKLWQRLCQRTRW